MPNLVCIKHAFIYHLGIKASIMSFALMQEKLLSRFVIIKTTIYLYVLAFFLLFLLL